MKTKLLFTALIFFTLNSFSQALTYNQYRDYVLEKYDFKKNYDSQKNIYLKDNIVHIFIDEQGNLIETGIPTTAIEKYSYKLHLLTNTETIKNTTFEYSYRGEYKPTLNIQNETLNEVNSENPLAEKKPKPKIIEYSYAIIGPFTTDFTITLKKKIPAETTILERTINVAKTYHVTISTGLFMTTLKNPTNIKESTNSKGETTLVADDKNTRGLVSLNAVFYPKGRSFLFPPSGGLLSPERFGVLIGTQIDKDQFENFIGGIQFDFARGGSVAFGAHYGRRTTVAGYKNFDFGNEKFEGDINTDIVKEWNIGFFIGANIDLRIFGQLFKTAE
jgi:hypothetical protein